MLLERYCNPKLPSPIGQRTQVISRQEFTPPLGPRITEALIDPLHIKNNTSEKVNQLILCEAFLSSKAKKTRKFHEIDATE